MSSSSAPLGELVTFDRMIVSPQQAGARRYVGLEHLLPDGSVRHETQGQPPISDKFAFGRDHVLYGKLRPYLRKVARPDFDGMCSTDILPLRPSDRVSRDFLFHVLRTEEFATRATARSAGVNLPRISPSALAEFAIPLPPLPEQRRIAAILDKADAIRARRRAALADADALARATFLHLFGDARTIFERWPIQPLGELLSFLTSGSRGWAEHYRPDGATFIRIENVRRGWIDLLDRTFVQAPDTAEAKRTRVQAGDVLLSITADLGRTGVVPDDIGEAYINQHLALLRPAAINPIYLSAFLSAEAGQRQFARLNRSGVKAGLNFDDIRSVRVPVPLAPSQERFAALVSRGQQVKRQLETALTDADALYASLAARAFRGEL